MIAVNRDKVDPPESLSTKGVQETEKAIAFYSDQNNLGKSFKYKAYSADDVKLALDRLFHGKCAYCETVYASVHPMDVEHWRPKGMVTRINGTKKETVMKPGYYWLAAEWTNLLPSCIDCNRQRNQHEAQATEDAQGLDGTGEAAAADESNSNDEADIIPADLDEALRRVSRGKKNLFPVKDNIYSDTPEKYETAPDEPLLLNPCEDEPETFLEFVDEAIVRPRVNGIEDHREKAHQSILVYGLNRSRLVYERKEHVLEIKAHIYTVERLAIAYERLDLRRRNDKKVALIVTDIIEHEMRILRRYMKPNRPYALMARQIIGDFFAQFKRS